MRVFASCALMTLMFVLSIGARDATADTNVLIILDSSGSMWEQIDGVAKTVTAKKVLDATLKSLPAEAHVGLMSYGHRRKGDCSDIELLSPIGSDGRDAVAAKVNALKPKGDTPIAGALLASADAFKGLAGGHNIIVLVTDGAEECKGDPCAAAQQLSKAGLDLHINVVGFHLKSAQREAVECVAREGNGKYYDAADATALAAAMTEVKAEVAEAPAPPAPLPPPPENNLLSPASGGQLLAAPNEKWAAVVSGKDADAVSFSGCGGLPVEAIFAFQNGQAATFNKFEMLIPGQGKWAKDFELLAADDSPAGTYRSLGQFTAQNLKMLKSPYQEFTFPDTTARYFKFRLLSGYPGDCDNSLTQIRLIGKAAEQPATAEVTPAATGGTNLLAASAGGQVLAAPDNDWARIVDGNDADMAGFSGCGGLPVEAIFGFKDGQAATFDSFEMLIPATGQWVKDFELLAADDSPTGTYRSLGQFSILNMRMLKTPYQPFAFPETTAKYFKLRVLSAYAGDCDDHLTQIHLMGKIADQQAPAAATATPAAPENNLLSAASGGQILAAPDDNWVRIIDGNDTDMAAFSGCGGLPAEAVFAFKDEKVATFDTFEILIPATGKWVKDFELLAADDSPTGTYRSLGQFTTANMRMLQTPYQPFKFPETTAKYFKLRVTSAYAGDCDDHITQIRLIGKPSS